MNYSSYNELLNKCPEESRHKFLHGVVDSICHGRTHNYKAYSDNWSLEEWWIVTDHTKDLCWEIYNSGEGIKAQTGISDENISTLQTVVSVRKQDMKRCAQRKLAETSNAMLQNFDWKLKMVMSTDKLSSVHEPLLTLDLDVKGKSEEKFVSVEMNKEELKNFINSLEGANKAVQQLLA